jgi:hypothetical protein
MLTIGGALLILVGMVLTALGKSRGNKSNIDSTFKTSPIVPQSTATTQKTPAPQTGGGGGGQTDLERNIGPFSGNRHTFTPLQPNSSSSKNAEERTRSTSNINMPQHKHKAVSI